MDTNITEDQSRPLWQRIEPVRILSILIVSAVTVIGLAFYGVVSEQTVFACNDKEKNPPDVQKLCKRLTKHQWWGAYYQGIQP